jgi:hypothetical protein
MELDLIYLIDCRIGKTQEIQNPVFLKSRIKSIALTLRTSRGEESFPLKIILQTESSIKHNATNPFEIGITKPFKKQSWGGDFIELGKSGKMSQGSPKKGFACYIYCF